MPRPTFALALAVVLSLPLFARVAPAAAQDFDSAGERQMLARINAMRAAQTTAPLTRLEGLDAAARAHSADMANQQQLSHVSESSGTPANRVSSAGVDATAVSENVALHRGTELAHEALLSSAPHRANMLSADSTHVGLAALRTDQGVYLTQVFATIAPPAEEATPEPAPAEPADVDPAPLGSAIVAPAIVGPQSPPARGLAPPSPGTPPVAGAPPPPDAPPTAGSPQGGTLAPQPGSNGTVIIHRNGQNTVIAYWVFGSGRWWYYPFTVGARPGTQLQADLSVQGPPRGYPADPTRGRVAARRPQAHRIPPPPGSQIWNVPPPPVQGSRVVIQPFQGRVQIQPGTTFYALPPPPMTGRPTRSFRRQQQQWLRAYRRWQREQRRLRRRAL